MSIHFHTLKIKDVRQETQDCISLAFEIPDALNGIFHFKQGQNLTLRAPVDGVELRRSYSICSAPYENELRIAIKKVENGKFSTYANTHLKIGDTIEVLPPTGNFFTNLSVDHKKNYLGFAAGSGITPIISIIKSVLHEEPHSTFTLVYGNKNRNQIIFFEALEALKNRYMDRFTLIHVLSREKTEAEINYGRINSLKCEQLSAKLIQCHQADEIFICGPEEMIFTIKEWLLQNNVDEGKIHFELFTTPGVIAQNHAVQKSNAVTAQATITIKLDGRSMSFEMPVGSEQTILEAAIDEGIDLPFACKGGVCSTCKTKLLQGEIEMDVNWALEADEVQKGFILACQSHPKTSNIVIDFDER